MMVEPDAVEFLFTEPAVEEGANRDAVALDAFGKLLMVWVRDYAIAEADDILAGKMMGLTAAQFPNMPDLFSPEQVEILHRFIPDIVDRTLGHLVWKLEETAWLEVAARTQAGTVPSLRDATSEGLESELQGWIERFSRQRYNRLPSD